jgi:hypothetical protein
VTESSGGNVLRTACSESYRPTVNSPGRIFNSSVVIHTRPTNLRYCPRRRWHYRWDHVDGLLLSVSMTLSFYDVPAGATGIERYPTSGT